MMSYTLISRVIPFIFFLNCFAANTVLFISGTRPEIIKLAPVYLSLKTEQRTLWCHTGQHKDLACDVLKLFNICPDFNLDVMEPNQSLATLTKKLIESLTFVVEQSQPNLIVVQGDTTSAFVGALVGYLFHIPVAHVEAGLRTNSIYDPFPEEMNRRFISLVTHYHFAPTIKSYNQLLDEKIPPHMIFLTGNTVVDALILIKQKIDNHEIAVTESLRSFVESTKQKNKKIMLLTAHRRESFGDGLRTIFNAIKFACNNHPELEVIFPMHPNPAVKQAAIETNLFDIPNLTIIKPVLYSDLVYLLHECNFVATDSGGIQEEAASLGKTILILRNSTERTEGIEEKLAQLVGVNFVNITNAIDNECQRVGKRAHSFSDIYGNGTASIQITKNINTIFQNQ